MSSSAKLGLLTVALLILFIIVEAVLAPHVNSLVFSLIVGVFAIAMVAGVAAAQRWLAAREPRRQ